jgi:ABC-type multidrug transport system ATPase subunit
MHDNSSDWSCQNLQCTCITNTTFCGAVVATNLTSTIDGLSGTLGVNCGAVDSSTGTANCNFTQSVLNSLFGSSGLGLSGCTFGECVRQSVIDETGNSTPTTSSSGTGTSLSPGVIAGLTVVGGLIALGLLFLLWGFFNQHKARRTKDATLSGHRGGVGVEWTDVSCTIPTSSPLTRASNRADAKLVLNNVSGRVAPGQMMAILGPSGAGKTTLVEIIAGKSKSGCVTGTTGFVRGNNSSSADNDRPSPRIGFVPQQDVLPPMLTVREALLFAAHLRLPESVPGSAKLALVEDVMEQLGLASLADTRIGSATHRGLSGGEMRRVSIGLELVARPDVLILDEPTSGLDSVSAANVANVLRSLAHDPDNPRVVIASIHQPSSHLYQSFDEILLLSRGRALYSGPGGFAPTRHFAGTGAPEYKEGWNIAEWLLEIASAPPEGLALAGGSSGELRRKEDADVERDTSMQRTVSPPRMKGSSYPTTFLTQLEVLAGREWKILRR